jgi:hypothetical protein
VDGIVAEDITVAVPSCSSDVFFFFPFCLDHTLFGSAARVDIRDTIHLAVSGIFR